MYIYFVLLQIEMRKLVIVLYCYVSAVCTAYVASTKWRETSTDGVDARGSD